MFAWLLTQTFESYPHLYLNSRCAVTLSRGVAIVYHDSHTKPIAFEATREVLAARRDFGHWPQARIQELSGVIHLPIWILVVVLAIPTAIAWWRSVPTERARRSRD